jgi:hypothetical protein
MKKRAERKISFLVAFFLVLAGKNVFGQERGLLLKRSAYVHPLSFVGQGPRSSAKRLVVTVLPGKYDYLYMEAPGMQPLIPSNLYYVQSGFFCKREWELERATHVPFRFRLGSLDYCNELEGKH